MYSREVRINAANTVQTYEMRNAALNFISILLGVLVSFFEVVRAGASVLLFSQSNEGEVNSPVSSMSVE
jgi:hypothetical protein